MCNCNSRKFNAQIMAISFMFGYCKNISPVELCKKMEHHNFIIKRLILFDTGEGEKKIQTKNKTHTNT